MSEATFRFRRPSARFAMGFCAVLVVLALSSSVAGASAPTLTKVAPFTGGHLLKTHSVAKSGGKTRINLEANLTTGDTGLYISAAHPACKSACGGMSVVASAGYEFSIHGIKAGSHTVAVNWSVSWLASVWISAAGSAASAVGRLYLVIKDVTNGSIVANSTRLVVDANTSGASKLVTGCNGAFGLATTVNLVAGHHYAILTYIHGTVSILMGPSASGRGSSASLDMRHSSYGPTLNWLSIQ